MTLEQKWIEYDYNPFILFDSQGKIISLNAEAQFLLGSVTPKELFELAKTYASINFGFKTTFIDLEYGRYKFFGLMVGYEDEEQIGIKLYQAPSYKLDTVVTTNGELTNIFTVIDLCIATNSITAETEFTKEFDPTIPDIIIDSSALIKLLNKIYDAFKESTTIHTKVFFRIGEHIKFEEKKYSLFSIEIGAEKLSQDKIADLEALALQYGFHLDIQKNTIVLSLPIVTP